MSNITIAIPTELQILYPDKINFVFSVTNFDELKQDILSGDPNAGTYVNFDYIEGQLNPVVQLMDVQESSKDGFGTPISISPTPLFDIKHIDSKNPKLIEEITELGGQSVLNIEKSCVDMSVTDVIGSRVLRQSKRYFAYQPDRAFRITFTWNPTLESNTGARSRAGFFDDERDKDPLITGQRLPGDGLFMEYYNGFRFVNRSSDSGLQVDTFYEQSDWNLDKLDGTGASGYELKPENRPIFFIDFGWLSMRGFRFGVKDGGKVIIAHDQKFSDQSNPFMSRATLPIRYEIEQIDGISPATSQMVCSALSCFGEYNPKGAEYSIDTGSTTKVVGGNQLVPILSIRLTEKVNRRTLKVLEADILSSTNANVIVRKYLNAPLTGAVWLPANEEGTSEYDLSATGIDITGLFPEQSKGMSNNSDMAVFKSTSDVLASSSISGKPDTITYAVLNLSGQNESIFGCINYGEII